MDKWTRWYRDGTVSIAEGTTTVTGKNTYFTDAGIHAGDIFSLDGIYDYEIASVTDATHIELATPYKGLTKYDVNYSIIRNFTAGTEAEVAAQAANLVYEVGKYIDKEHTQIQGKSAYDIARENGYVGTAAEWVSSLKGDSAYAVAKASGYSGTQAEWLESLKAAGEWSKLSELNEVVNGGGSAWTRNVLWGGRNLGNHPTAEQYAAIRNGTFKGLRLGDYWQNATTGWRYYIVGFNYFSTQSAPVMSVDITTGEVRAPIGSTVSGNWYSPRPSLAIQSDPGYSPHLYFDENEDRTDDGGWVGYGQTNFYRKIRPIQLADATEVFGDRHLFEWTERVYTKINSEGIPSASTYMLMRCELPTHLMLTGQYFVPFYGTKANTLALNAHTRADQPASLNQLPYWKMWTGSWNWFRIRDVWGLTGAGGAPVGEYFRGYENGGFNAAQAIYTTSCILRVGSESANDDAIITDPEPVSSEIKEEQIVY